MFLSSCDTLVAMSDVTESGSVIFAKNSDRQVNEPLAIRYVPSATHLPNTKVKTTYIEIDQVEQTYACVFFAPANIFGAEMGFNSHGLVMGNEALFTKISSIRPALTGMDLVRLVLERCSTSEQGKNLVARLLNQHGQGGNCGFSSSFYYQNSFLIADAHEAWVMETVGKNYAAKRIRSGIATISNEISFGNRETFDECSEDLIIQAINHGWCQSIDDFHFHRCYSGFSWYPQQFYNGWVKTTFARSNERQCRSQQLLSQGKGIKVEDVFAILRDHQQSNDCPGHGLTNVDLCMHAAFGPIRFNQTTGSLVSVISTDRLPTHYATGTSCPCLSIFKPIWLTETSISPSFLRNPTDLSDAPLTYSPKNIWWKSEVINRNIMKYYQQLSERIRQERTPIEQDVIKQSPQLALLPVNSTEERNHFSLQCFDQADQMITEWFREAFSLGLEQSSEYSWYNEFAWESWRKEAKIPSNLLQYSRVSTIKRAIIYLGFIGLLLVIIFSPRIYDSNMIINRLLQCIPVVLLAVATRYLIRPRQPLEDRTKVSLARLAF